MHTYIFVYPHRYLNVACSVHITYVHVFRADCSARNNTLVCSSLGKPTSPTVSFPRLPIVLCVVWGLAVRTPSTLTCPTVSPLLSSCLSSHVGRDFMGVASAITTIQSLTANSLILWLLQPVFSLFFNVSWALGMGVFYRYPLGLSFSSLHFDWLWFLVTTRSFLNEGWRLH